ncbi:MAG: hypothetical protein J6O04_08810 [Selenomonadaceae bacterium]|nr:hypothetical protein [Selenomonadaceae bacterium]
MLTLQGYYDGVAFRPLEKVTLPKNQPVIMTVNIIDKPNQDTLEAKSEVEYMKKHPEEFEGYTDIDLMMEELLE